MIDVIRLRFLIEKKGIKQKDFAKKIGLSEQGFYDVLKKKSTKRSTVDKMAKALGIATELLYEGNPEALDINSKTVTLNITYVPVQAQAGFFSGFSQDQTILTRFFLPEMTDGNYFAFNITGDSMAPTIKSGDIVVCSKLENKDEIRPQTVHVIFDKTEGIVVKRLVIDGEKLRCISDNKQYQEYSMNAKSVKDIYRVRRVITSNV